MSLDELRKSIGWKVTLAADVPQQGRVKRVFDCFALTRDAAIGVARGQWGEGSGWTFVVSAVPANA